MANYKNASEVLYSRVVGYLVGTGKLYEHFGNNFQKYEKILRAKITVNEMPKELRDVYNKYKSKIFLEMAK